MGYEPTLVREFGDRIVGVQPRRIVVRGEPPLTYEVGGEESISFGLRYQTTRCSPDIYLGDINEKWKTFAINIEKEAFDFVDTGQIDNIRFEISSPKCAEKELGSMLLVEEIKFF